MPTDHTRQPSVTGSDNSEQADAWRHLKAALIAVSDRLDDPYEGSPGWTPWSRFVKPAIERMEEALNG